MACDLPWCASIPQAVPWGWAILAGVVVVYAIGIIDNHVRGHRMASDGDGLGPKDSEEAQAVREVEVWLAEDSHRHLGRVN